MIYDPEIIKLTKKLQNDNQKDVRDILSDLQLTNIKEEEENKNIEESKWEESDQTINLNQNIAET